MNRATLTVVGLVMLAAGCRDDLKRDAGVSPVAGQAKETLEETPPPSDEAIVRELRGIRTELEALRTTLERTGAARDEDRPLSKIGDDASDEPLTKGDLRAVRKRILEMRREIVTLERAVRKAESQPAKKVRKATRKSRVRDAGPDDDEESDTVEDEDAVRPRKKQRDRGQRSELERSEWSSLLPLRPSARAVVIARTAAGDGIGGGVALFN